MAPPGPSFPRRLSGASLVEVVNGRTVRLERTLDATETLVERAPARGDQVDEKGEIVDSRVAVDGQVVLDALEPADRLVRQPPDLVDATGHRRCFGAEALLDGRLDALGKHTFELGCRRRELLDLGAGPLQGRLDVRLLRSPFGRRGYSLVSALDRAFVHRKRRYLVGRMKSVELEYDLPPELIAQQPAERRDHSRLLVFDRATGEIRHRRFDELLNEVGGLLVVVSDTRVIPARLRLSRPGGGAAQVLLLEHTGEDSVWEALAKPSSRLRAGQRLGPVELLEPLGEGRWRVRLSGRPHGEAPLPPYITEPIQDSERYQTVYAREEGSAAAPTAGLHFTPDLLSSLDVEHVTLHVGLDTFRPLAVDNLAEHTLHGERYAVSRRAWERIRSAERVLAVGTTTVRVLETVARGGPLTGRTELFVMPPFEFRRVDALLTNFHLPRSTLLALVMAFAGIEETRRLYSLAIAERYRFYSFGDAMLVL